ncbi:MAG: fluoride efflux transporter CrcB [Oscillochloris sp.]|nr:fluoride efflux transporter CrcB [Oscillochloris sp.]
MQNMIAVALGAAVGANLRYLLSGWVAQRMGSAFPYGTFLINVLGCLFIGVILTLAATKISISEPLRLLLVTGLLGGFTTFSTFGYESFALITSGNWLSASVYMIGSLALGLAAVFFGAGIVRLILGG